jgi:peptidoglycan pentaglycine glycine transferase (the first glycine)
MPGARIRPATDADRPAWDAFVRARSDADLLQSWAWGECNALAGEPPMRLVAERGDGTVRGVAQALVRPAGLGRSVAYVPHGPVWERQAPDAEALLGAMLDALRAMAVEQRAIVVKLDPRDGGDTEAVTSSLRRYGLKWGDDLQAPTTRIVDLLDGSEALMKSWSSGARNLTRRAEREGVEVHVDRTGDPESIAVFHELLAVTAGRSGFHVRSEEFLRLLATRFAERDAWYLGIARFEGTPFAGMAVPRFGDRGYYLYGASLRDAAYKHKFGSYAVMAALQRALAADGARSLDMWGVAEPDDTQADPAWQGFSAFKREFGGTPVRHPGLFDLVVNPAWYRLREVRQSAIGWLRR